jgi:hypothetical protein
VFSLSLSLSLLSLSPCCGLLDKPRATCVSIPRPRYMLIPPLATC